MPIVSEDVAQGAGANASMDYGNATEMSRLQREVESSSRSPQPGGPQPPAQGQPQPADASPVQPTTPPPGKPWNDPGVPRDPTGRLDMSKVFSDLKTVPTWRQNAQTWAAHPQAGPYLKMLGKLAQSDQRRGS